MARAGVEGQPPPGPLAGMGAPPYIAVAGKAPLGLARRPLVAHLCLLALVPAVYESARLVGGLGRSRNEWLCFYLGPTVVLVGLALLVRGQRAVMDTLALFHLVLTNDAQRERLRQDAASLVDHRTQNRFALGFGVVLPAVVFLMDAQVPPRYQPLLAALALVFGMVSGYGVGLATMTIRWLGRVPGYGELDLFVIPSRTAALRAVSRLAGLLAFYFSMQAVLELWLFFSIRWANPTAVTLVRYWIMLPVVAVALALFVYPQWCVRRVIVARKEKLLGELERRARRAAREEAGALAAPEIEGLTRWVELHRTIMESPSVPIELLTAVRLLSSLLLPVLSFWKDSIKPQAVLRGIASLLGL